MTRITTLARPRRCPVCRVGVVKTKKAKVCAKCGRLAFKKRQDEIIRATRRRKIGESSQAMPGL